MNYLKKGVKVFRISIFVMILILPLTTVVFAKPSNDTINFWVMEALREDPRVDAWGITVSTDNGIVTLTGTVLNLAEKNYADLETKKINGVRGVIDKIVVKPAYRTDADIRQDISKRLHNSSFIKSQNIEVTVFNGEATLKGTVRSWIEGQHATMIASEVRGIKAVHNNLEIMYKSKRTDDEIQKDVIAEINRDVYLTGLPIDVAVQDGVVNLTGEVGNAYQKERAWSDAWVWNAKDVKNKIEVKWWDEKGVREKSPRPTDKQIEDAVLDELIQDLRIDDTPFDIKVKVKYGHATLRGTVPTYYQKRMAGKDVRDVVGVVWVSNLLTVRPDIREDWAILDDVNFEMGADYALSGQDIKVRVRDGVVTLSGDVNTPYEKTHAADVASRIWGVRDVFNYLKVNLRPQYTDAALKERIKSRLFANWETRWVANQITVKVKSGKATLTGTVNTWPEYNEASSVAFLTDGIWAVDNQLTISDVDYPWGEWYYVGPDHIYDPYYDYWYYWYPWLR